MKQTKRHLYQAVPNWLLVTVAVFVSVIFLLVAAGFVLAENYQTKITPGVSVAGEKIGGKTPAEARKILENKTNQILASGIEVRFAEKAISIPAKDIELTADTAVSPIGFEIDETLQQAWLIGHQGNWLTRALDQVRALISGRPIELTVAADPQTMMGLLSKEFADYHQPAQDAHFSFENGDITVIPEKSGQTLDYEGAVITVLDRLRTGNVSPVTIESETDLPQISRSEAEMLVGEVEDFINIPKTTLTYNKLTWPLTKNIVRDWIGVKKENKKVSLVFSTDNIKIYLTETVAPKINREPTDAKLTMENGRASVWQAGQSGLEVDLDATADRLARLREEPAETIEVSVKEIASASVDSNAEELGLREIIGTGTSQFAGSPPNRRHNIRVGANSLHGLLIKPGEEFSLLKALGEIDGKHGYLPELVIKENKTVPEYGGGLCQIGTTVFRTTFNSGLPVTQRRNHSYRVVYYEPAGTDATIYDPAPDYRFVNDTGHHILIQARLEGNTLAFDFWGTKDGRQVEYTKPVIYNIVQPAPTKIVETPDLKEGEKKCTERAHAGADAYFDYKVTYPSGEIKEKRFSSHYVPWQAVCLVGAKKAPEGGIPTPPTETVTPSVQ